MEHTEAELIGVNPARHYWRRSAARCVVATLLSRDRQSLAAIDSARIVYAKLMNSRYLTLIAILGLPVAASGGHSHVPSRASNIASIRVAASPALPPEKPGGTSHPTLANRLLRQAPGVDPKVLGLALSAVSCARADGAGVGAQRLAVIDYSRSSLQPRLWVFDLASQRLLYREVVAHGQGSGGDMPTRFSNDDGSHASSLGLFVTRDTYIGHNGYSLRMQGLEQGFNDAAMARAIVMHGATYVNPTLDKGMHRLGRSWGCPALRTAVAKPIIDVMKNGQFVFSYYPDQAWLAHSALLKCAAVRHSLAAVTEPVGKA
jgi:hypothetical protein